MSTKKRSYAAKIRQTLRKEKIDIDPLLDATLEELERLSVIRDDLFESYQDEDTKLFREHTNKAGATNVIMAAEVTEYKNYSDKFNKTVAAIEKMVEARRPVKDDSKQQEDPLAKIIRRDLNAQS
ncbi:hypothetical protein [Ruminiclostridium cellobioparum]|uniref:hypothetical protein n=1 Tax=Ruminiclostridium cellobioparum TaxID=29355 RepID=UPI000489403F|nr:hypothetical protein [Ruminiclostridium cellobioparum]